MIKKNGIYLDATFGGGGHSKKILEQLSKEAVMIGIDQDYNSINRARENFSEFMQLILVEENFKNIDKVLGQLKINEIDGIIFDLGLSSDQLDNGERGFSFMNDGPLDMRMNPKALRTAEEIINKYPIDEIEKIIKKYGEEKFAKRIAEKIIETRSREKITTTNELANIIKSSLPGGYKREKKHPATRTFQAIRIAVNNELENMEISIEKAIQHLKIGGRICVISYHSLEDRLVRKIFNKYAIKNSKDKKLMLKIITKKPIMTSAKEKSENRRSRSAKLRVAEKI